MEKSQRYYFLILTCSEEYRQRRYKPENNTVNTF
jgi:hypothetical protein